MESLPIEILGMILSLTNATVNKFVCKLWKQLVHTNKEDLCAIATKNNWLDVLIWARKNGCEWDENTFDAACENEDPSMFAWLARHDIPWDYNSYRSAIINGRIDALEFLRSKHKPYDDHGGESILAAEHRQFGVLRWMKACNYPIQSWGVSHMAIRDGMIDVLDWLHNNRYELDEDVARHAAEYGNVEALAWLKRYGYRWDDRIVDIAMIYGQIHILDWCRDNGAVFNTSDVRHHIARPHHQSVLTWLKNNGYIQD